jgi:hypothetical protein
MESGEQAHMEPAVLRPRYPRRATITLALILAAILLSQLAMIVNLVQRLPAALANDEMAQNEKSFAEAKKSLPRSGVIGYLSDPQDGGSATESAYGRRYQSAAYVLAPLVIADSVEPDLILGNFFSADGMQKAMAGRKFVVLHDFRNGVFILRKEGS